jgi:hypothetical protein
MIKQFMVSFKIYEIDFKNQCATFTSRILSQKKNITSKNTKNQHLNYSMYHSKKNKIIACTLEKLMFGDTHLIKKNKNLSNAESNIKLTQ